MSTADQTVSSTQLISATRTDKISELGYFYLTDYIDSLATTLTRIIRSSVPIFGSAGYTQESKAGSHPSKETAAGSTFSDMRV